MFERAHPTNERAEPNQRDQGDLPRPRYDAWRCGGRRGAGTLLARFVHATLWLLADFVGERVSETLKVNNVVVIAEDYPDISQLVGDILRDEGYRVVAVTRGADVIPAVKQHRPALLVLDLSLPDVPGNEVLRELTASPETSCVPVVIVSAYTEQLRRVPQVRAVVNKPFDLTTLVEAVQEAQKPQHLRA